jgi:hypothetical protein
MISTCHIIYTDYGKQQAYQTFETFGSTNKISLNTGARRAQKV